MKLYLLKHVFCELLVHAWLQNLDNWTVPIHFLNSMILKFVFFYISLLRQVKIETFSLRRCMNTAGSFNCECIEGIDIYKIQLSILLFVHYTNNEDF